MNELITQLTAPILFSVTSILVGAVSRFLGRRKVLKYSFFKLNQIIESAQCEDIKNAHNEIAKKLGIYWEETIYKISRIVFLISSSYIVLYSIYFLISGISGV